MMDRTGEILGSYEYFCKAVDETKMVRRLSVE